MNNGHYTTILSNLIDSIEQVIVGQQSVIQQVMIAFLAQGHVLIEGVPGLGKTLLVRTLATTFDGVYSRIQFTPDLMPSDITGHVMYDMKEGRFNIRKGQVFANLLLADEINRAPAKTQSALLEVMQEHSVTIEGQRLSVPLPFMVLATQNPLEHDGTYPLPEAELDRFIMKIIMDYPTEKEEIDILKRFGNQGEDSVLQSIQATVNAEQMMAIQHATSQVLVDDKLLGYAASIARTSREWQGVIIGAGPRASLALIRCARANAFIDGRRFVTPDDVQLVTAPVLRHRLQLSAESELEGKTTDHVIEDIIQSIKVPRV